MDKGNLVIQSNYLIRGRKKEGITLREQKILYTVISMLEPTDDEFKEYRIKVRDLYNLIGVNKNTPTFDMKETADKLTTRNFELPIEIDNPNDFDFISIVSRCKYLEKEGDLIVKLNPDLKPFLLQLKRNFTSYRLFNILKLKSEYSIVLFQFLKSYSYMGNIEIPLNTLREFLFFDNLIYQQYAYFKRDVLNKSIKEINEKTDIFVEFEEIKQGRKVESIRFVISEVEKEVNLNFEKINNKIINKEKTLNDLLIELFLEYDFEVTFQDLESIIELSKDIWEESELETNLFRYIRYMFEEIEELKTPIGFLKYKLNIFKVNVKSNFKWNHGENINWSKVSKVKNTEKIPDWFDKRNEIEVEEISEDEKTLFEKEKQKILEKLKTL